MEKREARGWMLDAGCWILDAGCRMPDARCRMPDARCRMLGVSFGHLVEYFALYKPTIPKKSLIFVIASSHILCYYSVKLCFLNKLFFIAVFSFLTGLTR